LDVPVPENACITLLIPLRSVMLPAAAPGAPVAGEKATLNCWLCPAAIVNGVDGKPEIENAVPVTVLLVMVMLAPTAVKVPLFDVLVVPSGTEPKLKLDGFKVRPAPVPDKVAGDGVFEALLVNDKLPETLPVIEGAKAILKLALWPDVIVNGKAIPLSMNPVPINVSEVIVRSPLVAFRVPPCPGLVTPTLTVPKVKVDGVIDSCPAKSPKLIPL
jgi:hypothetical protein